MHGGSLFDAWDGSISFDRYSSRMLKVQIWHVHRLGLVSLKVQCFKTCKNGVYEHFGYAFTFVMPDSMIACMLFAMKSCFWYNDFNSYIYAAIHMFHASCIN